MKSDSAHKYDLPAPPANPASVVAHPQLSKSLAMDIAIGTSEDSICEAYGLLHHELRAIMEDAQFLVELGAVKTALQDNAEVFKLKCQMQAEHLIDTSWNLIHNPLTADAVKADLIKSTIRWAGHERTTGGGDTGGKFTVNIDLSGADKGITIEGSSE